MIHELCIIFMFSSAVHAAGKKKICSICQMKKKSIIFSWLHYVCCLSNKVGRCFEDWSIHESASLKWVGNTKTILSKKEKENEQRKSAFEECPKVNYLDIYFFLHSFVCSCTEACTSYYQFMLLILRVVSHYLCLSMREVVWAHVNSFMWIIHAHLPIPKGKCRLVTRTLSIDVFLHVFDWT